MPVVILCMFRFVRLLGSGHQAIAVENLALRLQLAAFKRKRKRPPCPESVRSIPRHTSTLTPRHRQASSACASVVAGGEFHACHRTRKRTPIETLPLEERIRRRAHELYVQRG